MDASKKRILIIASGLGCIGLISLINLGAGLSESASSYAQKATNEYSEICQSVVTSPSPQQRSLDNKPACFSTSGQGDGRGDSRYDLR